MKYKELKEKGSLHAYILPDESLVVPSNSWRGGQDAYVLRPDDTLEVQFRNLRAFGGHEGGVFLQLTGCTIAVSTEHARARWVGRKLMYGDKVIAEFYSRIKLRLTNGVPEVLDCDAPRVLEINDADLKDLRKRYQALRNAVRAREKLGVKYCELVDAVASKRALSRIRDDEKAQVDAAIMMQVAQFQATDEWMGDKVVKLLALMCSYHGHYKSTGTPAWRSYLGWPSSYEPGNKPLPAHELIERWWRSGRQRILRGNGAAEWREQPQEKEPRGEEP